MLSSVLLVLGLVATTATAQTSDVFEWTPVDGGAVSWTEPTNWGDADEVPCTDDTVVIPAATTVTILADTMATAKDLRIGGNVRIQLGSHGLRLYKNTTCDRTETTSTFDAENTEGFWKNGDNWDDNNVPCSADVIHIPTETTVTIAKTTTAEIKVLRIGGRVNIAGHLKIYAKGKADCDTEEGAEFRVKTGGVGGKNGGGVNDDIGEGSGSDNDDRVEESKGEGLSGGGTAAIVIVILLVLAALAVGFVYKKKKDEETETGEGGATGTKAVVTIQNPAFENPQYETEAGGESGGIATTAGSAHPDDDYLNIAAEPDDGPQYDTAPAPAADLYGGDNYDELPAAAEGGMGERKESTYSGFGDDAHATYEGGDTYEEMDGVAANTNTEVEGASVVGTEL